MITVHVELNSGDGPSEDVLWIVERSAIQQAIAQANGNITRAAELLGIHRQTLQRKMKRLALR